jgi:hypothetical protein
MSKEIREQINKVKNWKQFLNENIDDEIKDIKDMIELYDDNYNVYQRRYLQTQSDEDRQKMNKWFKLKNEQEQLLKDIQG